MPLWGIGEFRTSNLSFGRTSDELGAQDVPISSLPTNQCDHAGAHDNLFKHVEPPIWLFNKDIDQNRQAHMEAADLGHTTINEAWTTTETSGPNGIPDPNGIGIPIETDHDANDRLNHCVGRGGAVRADSDDNGQYPNRLTGGSRGNGFHYEYEYIDSSGNHRRRHECLVATSSANDLTDVLDETLVSAEWDQAGYVGSE